MRTLLWALDWRTGCAQVPLFTSSPTKWGLIQLAALDASSQWEGCSLMWALPRRTCTQKPFTVSRVNNLVTCLVTHSLIFLFLSSDVGGEEAGVFNSFTAKLRGQSQRRSSSGCEDCAFFCLFVLFSVFLHFWHLKYRKINLKVERKKPQRKRHSQRTGTGNGSQCALICCQQL